MPPAFAAILLQVFTLAAAASAEIAVARARRASWHAQDPVSDLPFRLAIEAYLSALPAHVLWRLYHLDYVGQRDRAGLSTEFDAWFYDGREERHIADIATLLSWSAGLSERLGRGIEAARREGVDWAAEMLVSQRAEPAKEAA